MAFIVDTLKYVFRIDNTQLKAGLTETDSRVATTANRMSSKLGGAIKGLIVAWISWRSIRAIKDLGQLGAKADQAATAFENMAASIGADSKQILSDLREMSAGTVSDMELMQKAAMAVNFGIPMSRIAELMKIARSAAAAMGQDVSFMFDSIVTGIARQSRMILDNLGIIVKQEEIYREAVKRLGRELTEVEKKQIFLNETIRQGRVIIERVGDATETTAMDFAQLGAEVHNLKVAFGELIVPTLATFANILTKFVTYISPATTEFDHLNAKIENYEATIKMAEGWTGDWTEAIEQFRKKIAELKAEKFAKFTPEEELYAALGMSPPGVAKATDEIVAIIEDGEEGKRKAREETIRQFLEDWDFQREKAESWIAFEDESLEKRLAKYQGFLDAELLAVIENYEKEEMAAEAYRKRLAYALEIPLGKILYEIGIKDPDKIVNAGNMITQALNEVAMRMNKFAGEMVTAFNSFLSGDYVSAAFGLFDILSDLFSPEPVKELSREIEALYNQFNNLINAVEQLSLAEINAELEQAERNLRNYTDQITYWLEKGEDEYANYFAELARQTQKYIDEMREQLVLEGAREIESMTELRELLEALAGQEDAWDNARNIIDYFADMWDLSAEEQLALYELLQGILDENEMTLSEWMALTQTIKGLEDDIAEDRQRAAEDRRKGEDEVSQVMRTVTSITERQANMLVGVANTISAYVWEILQIMRGGYGMGGGAPTGGAGGGTTIGGIYMNFTAPVSPQTAQAFATSFRNELRGKGIQV